MFYVADTHALIWYLLGTLPGRVDEIFRQAETGETIVYIPTIVLAECFHLVKHGKIALDFDELLARIEESDNFIVVSFDFGIVKLLPLINAPELHDRIIVATARLLGAVLITKDKEIVESEDVRVVW